MKQSNQPRDEPGQRPELVHDHPRAADEEHDGNDFRRLDQPARHRHCGLERTDGGTLHGMVGACHHHTPSRRLVISSIELAGGQHPGERSGDAHTGKQENKRVRQTEAGHRNPRGHA